MEILLYYICLDCDIIMCTYVWLLFTSSCLTNNKIWLIKKLLFTVLFNFFSKFHLCSAQHMFWLIPHVLEVERNSLQKLLIISIVT